MATALISKVYGRDDQVHLFISTEEASALKAVLGKVGGSRTKSRRALIQNIWDSLDYLDINKGGWLDTEGRINFLLIPEPKTRKVS